MESGDLQQFDFSHLLVGGPIYDTISKDYFNIPVVFGGLILSGAIASGLWYGWEMAKEYVITNNM